MADEYCMKCLTKLRIVGSRSTFCPRCQRTFHPSDPAHIATEFELRTVDVIPAEAVVTPGVGIYRATTREHEVQLDTTVVGKVQTCLMCDTTMQAGCGQVCPNCNWVSPCNL